MSSTFSLSAFSPSIALLLTCCFSVFASSVFAMATTTTATIECRTGVDLLKGPTVPCANQCMNTTSPRATVYSCDFGGICEVLNLINGCVDDGPNTVCCCSDASECNFGFVPLKLRMEWQKSQQKMGNESLVSISSSKSVERIDGNANRTPKVPLIKVSKSSQSPAMAINF